MKKILIIMLLLLPIVYGVDIDLIIDQETLDSIDFDTINLMYHFNPIYINLYQGKWILKSDVNFLDIYLLYSTPNETYYEVQYTTFTYQYSDLDFFQCFKEGNNTDIECFETYVISTWAEQFLVNDWLQRKKLKSYQSFNETFISDDLRNYFIE